MMLERFTPDARAVIKNAVEHASRRGHRYVGGEHLLLAAVSTSQPASAVLCAHGVTPVRVVGEIVRRVGLGAGAGLFGGLDRTRWPRSGSILMRCGPGSNRPSGPRPSARPRGPRTRKRAAGVASSPRLLPSRRSLPAVIRRPARFPMAGCRLPRSPGRSSSSLCARRSPGTMHISGSSTSRWPSARSSAGWCRPSWRRRAYRNRPCAPRSASVTGRRAEPGPAHPPR